MLKLVMLLCAIAVVGVFAYLLYIAIVDKQHKLIYPSLIALITVAIFESIMIIDLYME